VVYGAAFLLGALLAGCSAENPVQPGDINQSNYGSRAVSFDLADQTADKEKSADVIEPKDAGSSGFELKAKYTYIRSHLGGGGVFVIRLNPDVDFTGDVRLQLVADPVLNARLDRATVNAASDIAELSIRPTASVNAGTYQIDVVGCHVSDVVSPDSYQTVSLEVEIIPWGIPDPRYAVIKRDPLVEWIEDTHPEFGSFSGMQWYPYITYPGILVVEHWTFLNDDWEMRICFHVMIPPYDWSMIQLRRHGEWDPIFAARREYNGTTYEIHEIPLSEYPTFFGY